MKPRLFVEAPAGLASVSLRLHGGQHCKPPISRQGSKSGYAEVLLATMGLRSGQGAGGYLWCEADPDVAALLRCYPDALMLRRVAEIIRGWSEEEPRALWERLRAERKARTLRDPAETVAAQLTEHAGTHPGGGSFRGLHIHRDANDGYCPSRDGLSDACHRLAEYAIIASSNRLINVAGPDLMNTGKGGTTFGGAEFATPAGDVAEAFERVAGEVANYAVAGTWSYRRGQPDSGFNEAVTRDSEWKSGDDIGIRPGETVEVIANRMPTAGGWPPVQILPHIPTADEIAALLGTPGDLEGVVIYSDPDYRDTTGYASTCRDLIPERAIGWDAYGAAVYISEAEPIPELPTWRSTEITEGRRGQKRTFSKQQQEWVTMNREPAHRLAKQVSMFGGGK